MRKRSDIIEVLQRAVSGSNEDPSEIIALIDDLEKEESEAIQDRKDLEEAIVQLLMNHPDMVLPKIAEWIVDLVESSHIAETFSDEEFQHDSWLLAFMEYNFLSSNYRELKAAEGQIKTILKINKDDILALSAASKIEHDAGILSPLVQSKGLELTRYIEEKHEIKFKFLSAIDNVKKN